MTDGSTRHAPRRMQRDGVFDSRDGDITYFYESQLPGESRAVKDRHYHPLEPRTPRPAVETRFQPGL